MYFWNYLEKQVWNNTFSYEDRKRLGSKCKLYIPKVMDNWELKIENWWKDFRRLNRKILEDKKIKNFNHPELVSGPKDSGSSSEWQEKIKNFLDRYLKLWKKIVFEEVENNKLLSFTW